MLKQVPWTVVTAFAGLVALVTWGKQIGGGGLLAAVLMAALSWPQSQPCRVVAAEWVNHSVSLVLAVAVTTINWRPDRCCAHGVRQGRCDARRDTVFRRSDNPHQRIASCPQVRAL